MDKENMAYTTHNKILFNRVYSLHREYYLVIKRNEVLIYTTTWKNLANLMPSERKQTQEATYMIVFPHNIQKRQIQAQNKWGAAVGWREERMWSESSGVCLLFWGDENVLNLGSGLIYSTPFQKPLNCTLSKEWISWYVNYISINYEFKIIYENTVYIHKQVNPGFFFLP